MTARRNAALAMVAAGVALLVHADQAPAVLQLPVTLAGGFLAGLGAMTLADEMGGER